MKNNIILKLFDPEYVKKFFDEKILPQYPDFYEIKKINIKPIKKYIWEKTYHVVIQFETTFVDKKGITKKLPIFCSAHSDEPRKNVYDSLKFLWENGFSNSYLTIPRPLFYSKKFKGTFYRGVAGKNLYQFIRKNEYKEIEQIVPKAAAWFAKLHKTPTKKARNFNPENSRIATVIPHIEYTLEAISRRYPQHYKCYKGIYKIFIKNEEDFLNSTDRRWLIHGDAHPENIIKISSKKLAVIDFTDLSLSDFTRDIGTFLQQIEFMVNRKINRPGYAKKIKGLFLENYLKYNKINIGSNIKKRIDNYYNWTAIRTANFFLLKDKPIPERAEPLIKKVCRELKIKL